VELVNSIFRMGDLEQTSLHMEDYAIEINLKWKHCFQETRYEDLSHDGILD